MEISQSLASWVGLDPGALKEYLARVLRTGRFSPREIWPRYLVWVLTDGHPDDQVLTWVASKLAAHELPATGEALKALCLQGKAPQSWPRFPGPSTVEALPTPPVATSSGSSSEVANSPPPPPDVALPPPATTAQEEPVAGEAPQAAGYLELAALPPEAVQLCRDLPVWQGRAKLAESVVDQIKGRLGAIIGQAKGIRGELDGIKTTISSVDVRRKQQEKTNGSGKDKD